MTSLHRFLTAPADKTSKSTGIFWFSFSLTFAAIYGLMVLQKAFSAEYVVQDDARQHVFWMERFIDPELFPGDLIANYFQSVAPAGYTALYRLMAAVGIDPLLLSKLLPPVLGLITSGYCFGVSMQMLPVPAAGFIGSLLLNHYIWMRDDVVSATPVAFVYPLFLAFLYYLLRKLLIPTCGAIALLGLFYPQGVLICAGILILQLLHFEKGRPHLSQNWQDYKFRGSVLGVAIVVMLLYAWKSSGGYGPVITAAEARKLPEFLPGGKSRFFSDNFWDFWFTGQRSGIMPRFGTVLPIAASFLLPVVLLFPSAFPLARNLGKKVASLVEIIIASLGMFLISHALLFRLHLPSRYTEHSLRVVTAIAAGIALTVILDAVFNWTEWGRLKSHLNKQSPPTRTNETRVGGFRLISRNFNRRGTFALIFAFLLFAGIIVHPVFLKRFPRTDYIVGEVPALYKFFAAQTKDILIASITEEVNNIPTFSKRSILVGGEGYPVPYHNKYYAQIRERTVDLINAQYSSDLKQVQNFIEKYGIDFWLIEEGAFTPGYLTRDRFIMQYQPAANEAIARLQQGKSPALASIIERCSAFANGDLIVLKADCITKATPD